VIWLGRPANPVYPMGHSLQEPTVGQSEQCARVYSGDICLLERDETPLSLGKISQTL